MARNADTFFNYEASLHPCVDALKEWCLMAELLKGMDIEPEFPNPGELLVTGLEDAHLLEKVGEKWFHTFDDDDWSRGLKSCVETLKKKLRGLDYIHAWALIAAVQWYWRHSDKIDFRKDPWWTLAFRRKPLTQKKEQSQPQRRTSGALARAEKRFAIYPAPRAIEVVGDSLPALNQAIECWAALVARATADNAKNFQERFKGDDLFYDTFAEWSMLAEVLKGMRFEAEFMNPGGLIASTVEDSHRLEGTGDRWLPLHYDEENRQPEIDELVRKLVEKLRNLDYSHAWAMILAVRWYWEHADSIDLKAYWWWTLQFRRRSKSESFRVESKSGEAKRQDKTTKKKKA